MSWLPPVYPITSTLWHASHLSCARVLLEGGATLVQVREKSLPDGPLYDQLCAIRELCHRRGARVLVNDRVDLALAADCDGVHLGQDDLDVSVARRLLGPNRLIGLSTHDRHQFERAQRLAIDYVALGPVFPTTTKADSSAVLGSAEVLKLLSAATLPTVVIGGVTLERAPELWRGGANAVAVISDIAAASDPAARLRSYLESASRHLEIKAS